MFHWLICETWENKMVSKFEKVESIPGKTPNSFFFSVFDLSLFEGKKCFLNVSNFFEKKSNKDTLLVLFIELKRSRIQTWISRPTSNPHQNHCRVEIGYKWRKVGEGLEFKDQTTTISRAWKCTTITSRSWLANLSGYRECWIERDSLRRTASSIDWPTLESVFFSMSSWQMKCLFFLFFFSYFCW